jgi:hypothetical protein
MAAKNDDPIHEVSMPVFRSDAMIGMAGAMATISKMDRNKASKSMFSRAPCHAGERELS